MDSSAPNEFDYIVCGAGTAGCVLASRLAEDPETSILLLEAGGPADSVPTSFMPAAMAKIFDTDDWHIESQPSPNVNGRTLKLWRGKFVGGSSATNGMVCIRGSKQDYDDWNIEGWSGEEMHRNMSRAESFRPPPGYEADAKGHGYQGPLVTSTFENAPITDMVFESFRSKGLPFHNDPFTSGEPPNCCGPVIRSVNRGLRTTAADFIKGDNRKPNIQIETHSYVDSITLESVNSKQRATGVKVVRSRESHKVEIEFQARREVLVCAGAYCSPTILMRSGIGPREEVERHGIRSVVDLPGVGQNLLDHPIIFLSYQVDKPGITNDDMVWRKDGPAKAVEQWMKDHTGFMAQFPFGAFAYARLDERLADSPLWKSATDDGQPDSMGLKKNQPNIEIWNSELYVAQPGIDADLPEGKYAFSIVVELFGQRSRGQVSLKSADALDNPIVDHNWLDDPLDILVLSEGCRFASEIVLDGAGTKDVVRGPWPEHFTHHTYTQREQWEPFVREHLKTCYHPSGTCKMGRADDATAVVDERLRCRGVEGLRVIDASIFPSLMQGHPQMAVYGTAEKAADMIQADA